LRLGWLATCGGAVVGVVGVTGGTGVGTADVVVVGAVLEVVVVGRVVVVVVVVVGFVVVVAGFVVVVVGFVVVVVGLVVVDPRAPATSTAVRHRVPAKAVAAKRPHLR
jgi:hypothetical protein